MMLHSTEVSMFLKVEDFTVCDNVFWGFQVRGFYIIEQICSAESKDMRVSGKVVTGTVPHREVQEVTGTFPSSRSHSPLHFVHSERSKVTVLPLVLLQGFFSLFSVQLSILKEIEEHWAVYSIGQCRRDRTCGAVKVIHSKILRPSQKCYSDYLTLSNHCFRRTTRNIQLTVVPVLPGQDWTVRFFHIQD